MSTSTAAVHAPGARAGFTAVTPYLIIRADLLRGPSPYGHPAPVCAADGAEGRAGIDRIPESGVWRPRRAAARHARGYRRQCRGSHPRRGDRDRRGPSRVTRIARELLSVCRRLRCGLRAGDRSGCQVNARASESAVRRSCRRRRGCMGQRVVHRHTPAHGVTAASR